MRTPCGIILATVIALAAVAAAAPLAEYPGEVSEKTGWKCVGSEEGQVVDIPFEGYYESKGGRIESPRFKLDGEIGKNRFYRLTFSAKCPVDGYWWVDFFDKDGVQLPDVNSRLYASDDWTPYDVMVPARPDAVCAQIAFVARKGALAKDVSMRRATVAKAAKWCNDRMATLPKLDAPETAGAHSGYSIRLAPTASSRTSTGTSSTARRLTSCAVTADYLKANSAGTP